MPTDLFDLAARISADTSGVDSQLTATQRKVLDLAKQFEAAELVAKKAAGGMAVSMAAVNAELGKIKVGNLSADYDKFANALRNNSINSRKAAGDFLNLFSKVSGHSKVTKEAEAATHKLSGALRLLSTSAVVAEGPMGGLASRLRAMGTEAGELGSLFGPAGLIVGGLLAAAGGAAALGIAIFELAKKSAEAGKQIFELSEKTNFSTEAISAFKVQAELSGTSIETVGHKLGGFNVALGQAQLGNKQMARALADMGVTSKNTDEAFGQFLKTFDQMGPSAKRNALEAKLFRDRTGELIPFLLQFRGNIEQAKKAADDLGQSFDEVSAKKAKEFDDKLKLLKLGIEGLGLQIGQRTIPAIESAMSDLSKSLGLQENSWRAWGEFIGNTLSGVVIETAAAAAAISQLLTNIKTGFQSGVGQIGRLADALATQNAPAFFNEFAAPNATNDPFGFSKLKTPGEAFNAERLRMQLQIANASQGSVPSLETSRDLALKGLGGGGGGRRQPRREVDEVAEAIRRMNEQVMEAASDADKWQKQIDRLVLSLQRKGLTLKADQLTTLENTAAFGRAIDKEKESINDLEKIFDQQSEDAKNQLSRRIEITANLRTEFDQQTSALSRLKFGEESNLAIATKVVARLIDEAKVVGGLTAEFKLLVAAILKTAAVRDQFLADQKTKGFQLIEKSPIQRAAELAAAAQEQDIKEKAEKVRQRIQDLAGQLTGMVDRAITDGFSGGVKKGLATLLQGLLDMIKNILLRQLEAQLVTLLTKIGTQSGSTGGGGGLFSKLFGALLSGLLGGLGGAKGSVGGKGGILPGIGGKAGGGLIFPGEFALVGEQGPELAFGGSSGLNITPNQNLGGGNTFVFNIRTPNPQAFMGRETQSQITRRMRAALTQQSLAG